MRHTQAWAVASSGRDLTVFLMAVQITLWQEELGGDAGSLVLHEELVGALDAEDTWGAQKSAQCPSVYRNSRWTEKRGSQCPHHTEWS